jgi:hypothetical protein
MSTRNSYKRLGTSNTGTEVEYLGEHTPGDPQPLDTAVNIEAGTLCVITWSNREAFHAELQAVIDKYAI